MQQCDKFKDFTVGPDRDRILSLIPILRNKKIQLSDIYSICNILNVVIKYM